MAKRLRDARRHVSAHGVAALARVLRLVPKRMATKLGAMGALIGSCFFGKYRRRALRHLAMAFGDSMSPAERRAVCRRMFANLGRSGMEMLTMSQWTREEIDAAVDVGEGGHERLRKLLDRGRGAILLTAHFGNWELFGAYAALHYDLHVVAREVRMRKYEEIMSRLREEVGIKVIYQSDSPRDILRILRRNAVIAILPDHDIHRLNGVFVRFFGHPAYTPSGPVALALASRAPLLPVYLLRDGDRHRIVFGETVEPKRSGNRERDLLEYTQQWNSIFEQILRRHPDHWAWFHKRWDTTQEKLMRRHGRTAPSIEDLEATR